MPLLRQLILQLQIAIANDFLHAKQSKEAGIRTLVALDDQGGEYTTLNI